MIKKRILILLCFILFITGLFQINGKGTNMLFSGGDNKDWEKFSENIKCVITADQNTVSPESDNYPLLNIHLSYAGDKKFTLMWDMNFGNVLWHGKFVMKSIIYSKSEDTSQLKFRTSNTYEPTIAIELKKGDSLTSIMDFTKLPGSYANNLFTLKGKAKISLLVVLKNGRHKLVSNELIITVK